jgi:NAD(P)H-dependent FMN reductase
MMKTSRILALSGSLRKASYNTALIEALVMLAPKHLDIVYHKDIIDLPLFNPDLDETRPPAVNRLQQELGRVDGLIIASPEYAHGISGVLKNALDWLVNGEEFVYMPVLLFNTSPRASHAQAALREVVKTMSGIVDDKASISIPLLGSNLDKTGIIQHNEISTALKASLNIFHKTVSEAKLKIPPD